MTKKRIRQHTVNTVAAMRLVTIARFADILQKLPPATTGLLSATLASSDGLTVASTLADTGDSDKLSAMAGSLSSLSNVLAREVGHEDPERLTLETRTGRVLALQVTGTVGPLVLVLVSNNAALLGQLLWHGREAVAEIAKVAGEDKPPVEEPSRSGFQNRASDARSALQA